MLKNKTFIVGALAGAGVAAAALAGAGMSWPGANAQSAPEAAQLVRTQGPVVFAPPPGAPMSFADIIDRVSPAVVSIETKTAVDARSLRNIPGFENFPFDIVPQQPPGSQTPEGQPTDPRNAPEQLGAGSGFFISRDGYIVTNNHVVAGASEITVTLRDERELKARVVGRDEATDLAVLKVDGSNFSFVEFSTQAKPRVGDWVIAVGNPFGLGGSATAGIVSAYGRNVGDAYVDFLQIDAPINRGNSGGPTFDIYGRVIGVNSAIFTPTGVSAGIGFAIPADVADRVTRQLISSGKVERGYLGVTIGSISEEVAESLNLPSRDGAIIVDVVDGGPSDQAGLEVGDIVVSLNGQKVKDNTDLTRRVGSARAGDMLRVEILRNGRPMTLQVRSGVRPTESELNARANQTPDAEEAEPEATRGGTPFIGGLYVAPLDQAARRRFGIASSVNGLVITDVARGSQAAGDAIRAGDVITRVDNQPATSVAQVQGIVERMRAAKRPSVLLMIRRGTANVPVPMELTPTPPAQTTPGRSGNKAPPLSKKQ